MSAQGYRTPLARARGLGAAHHGVGGFIAERATGVALIPLCLWAVWAVMAVAPGGYESAVGFLHSPVQATLAVLLLLVGAKHMQMGVRVIIEDYIDAPMTRAAAMLLNAGVCLFVAAAGVIAILKVAFAAVSPVVGV
jgi:succinate dehydrogenase / fumarate reductase membrane anchor subunit